MRLYGILKLEIINLIWRGELNKTILWGSKGVLKKYPPKYPLNTLKKLIFITFLNVFFFLPFLYW